MASLLTNLVFDISECTDSNDHTGALLHLASAIKDVASIDALNVIDNEHERVGHLSEIMSDLRNTIKERLFNNAESIIESDDFNLIKSMF
tara:strand:+ start:333 stop:602 length:270 start_codon:yes stop_codon:yes gene_type:complete